jgi:hypothetical protein
MTDNDLPPLSPRLHLPDLLKIGLQRLRLEALESLQNVRAFEHTGSTLPNSRTFGQDPIPTSTDWATVHRSTLENLLRVSFEYYRRLHDENDPKAAVLRLLGINIHCVVGRHPDLQSCKSLFPTECSRGGWII